MRFARFAIYYAPPAGSPLDRFGAGWLGGAPDPAIGLNPAVVAAATEAPARYGFHGTLKPPFALADGCGGREAIEAAVEALATRLAPARTEGLALKEIGRFLALVPVPDDGPIRPVADSCVVELDDFRAEASEAERQRRRAAGLTARQEELLDRWGYPYVMEAFRFHLTLTGPLDGEARRAVAAALKPALAPVLAAPFTLDALTLFGDPGGGRPFMRLTSYPLLGRG
ncbi:DUF1045 domain-containing protein [Marivibrio halodurans]|uniref:DUF1045 domain-containing protein n=1 Tax=Marivibrio halodurans TaxID=2039722 RepID=A0A8J7V073_9PROT|nr:DUF1045 domain-containing protein [Marivibrio halodurans]MBP5856471.1 DUF1045 domain-containing protein [Marivibrio halodurans]